MGAIVSGYNKLGQKQVAQHLLGQYSDMDVHKTVENFTLIFKKKKKKKKKKSTSAPEEILGGTAITIIPHSIQ
jgi:hypothetical protein